MAPLSRAGILSLSCLTIHYSVLSILLHLSRNAAGKKYHASSAVALTELFKILVSTGLVLWTGELADRASERKRELERRASEDSADLSEPLWVAGDGISNTTLRRASTDSQMDVNEEVSVPITIQQRREERRGSLTPSLQVGTEPLSLAKTKATGASLAPVLALIPATPAAPPSPLRTPDADALYPDRMPVFRVSNHHASKGSPQNLIDLQWWLALKEAVLGPGWWKLAIPAGLFVFQANAQYVASENLSVPIFQLAYQLKIPATALCSVLLLNRILTTTAWFSVFGVGLGVGIVQLYSSSTSISVSQASVDASYRVVRAFSSDLHANNPPNQALGLANVVGACMSSGFASVYLEKMLKTIPSPPPTPVNTSTSMPLPISISRPSIWVRNIQLSLFALLFSAPIVIFDMRGCWTTSWEVTPEGLLPPSSYNQISSGWLDTTRWATNRGVDTFFDGFSSLTWVVIALQVTGGLLGALAMLHADNIAKTFATSISIILSSAASIYLFNFQLSTGVALGAALIMLSTWTYTQPNVFRMFKGSYRILNQSGNGSPPTASK